MLRKIPLNLVAGAIVAGTTQLAVAAPVSVSNASSINAILGPGAVSDSVLLTTPMSSGNLNSTLYSQAFRNAAGTEWAYFYQIDNIGGPLSVVEQMTLANFIGGSGAGTDVGYMTAGEPAGFIAGGSTQLPQSTAIVDENLGPLVSVYFTILGGSQISSGEHSSVLYVTSDFGPGLITGNVIDGNVASGQVVGPIPEPGAATLIGITTIVLLARRWRGNT